MREKSILVLASSSPRRQELLQSVGCRFEVVVPDIDEEAIVHESPFELARLTAVAKAAAVRLAVPNRVILAADTVVSYQGEPRWTHLAKPADDIDATRMLSALSGRTHVVTTGVCILDGDEQVSFADRTWVTFRALSLDQIELYVASGEPRGKAGAYAIQGGAKDFVSEVAGSLSNVIGLPLESVVPHLIRLGVMGPN